MSIPPTTPGFAATWGVGSGGWGVGGVSEPFFDDLPNGESGTVFGSLFATGFGASAIGSGMVTFFATTGGGAAGVVAFATTLGGIGANRMFSVDTSCGAAACMAA